MILNSNTKNYEVSPNYDNWGHLLGTKEDHKAYEMLRDYKGSDLTAMDSFVKVCESLDVSLSYDTHIWHGNKGKFWIIKVGKAADLRIFV